MKVARTLITLSLASAVRGFACVSRSALSTSVAAGSVKSAAAASQSATSVNTGRNLGMMFSTTSPMDFAKAEIENNKVVVFSKSYCPFCMKTKKLLTKKGVDYKLYELNEMDDGLEIQDALLEISGQKTVPNVFINGVHLGGNSETQAADKSGQLDEMLAAN